MKIQKVLDNIKQIDEVVHQKMDMISERPRKTLERFPTLFLLLTTSGAVLVLFGFERFFDRVTFFRENPLLMIALGVAILIFTGKLYKKLDTNF